MHRKFTPVLSAVISAAALCAGAGGAASQTAPTPACKNGPPNQIWQYGMAYDAYPQPRPGITPGYAPPSQTTSADGLTTTVHTGQSLFPESDPWDNPTNLLPTVYHDVYDSFCQLVPNTTNSTPQNPYNLHAAPAVSPVDPTSPYDDLWSIIQGFRHSADDGAGHSVEHVKIDQAQVQRAIDILEGNPIPNRAYSGFPLLHYNGPAKFKSVTPIYDANGKLIGGNVNVHLIYYRSHIESDTSLLDPSPVFDVPWTVTYTVDTLDQGADDFSPSTMYFDDPRAFGYPTAGAAAFKPLVMMDLTFFPQHEAMRQVYQVKMAPGRYFNGTYTWGWRVHPGRVQFMENANKVALGDTLLNWEIKSFGPTPMKDHASQVAAINMISNLAPAKRMWLAFNMLAGKIDSHGQTAEALVSEIQAAFDDWDHRGRLPRGVTPDPNADITLFYANNTIYASVKGYVNPDSHMEYTNWVTRNKGAHALVKIINGDYFKRGYMSVDFGGMRGWENTFQNTLPVGGDGAWFTFGREHWFPNVNAVLIPAAIPAAPPATAPIVPAAALARDPNKEVRMKEEDPDGLTVNPAVKASLPSAQGDTFGVHWINLNWNFDPSRRLRFYQFDALHHDVAVFSMH